MIALSSSNCLKKHVIDQLQNQRLLSMALLELIQQPLLKSKYKTAVSHLVNLMQILFLISVIS